MLLYYWYIRAQLCHLIPGTWLRSQEQSMWLPEIAQVGYSGLHSHPLGDTTLPMKYTCSCVLFSFCLMDCFNDTESTTQLFHIYQWTRIKNNFTHWGRATHTLQYQQSRQSLVQIMAWRLFGAKSLSEPMHWLIVHWILGNLFKWNLNQTTTIFIQEKHLEMFSGKWRSFCLGLNVSNKQRVLMHRHQGWNVRHGLCHIYMRYLYIYELFIAFVCFVVCSLL